jgi:hypothetical protein
MIYDRIPVRATSPPHFYYSMVCARFSAAILPTTNLRYASSINREVQSGVLYAFCAFRISARVRS